VIAALSLTPLVATQSKAQLALSQTLSRPHDDPDGDNEAPYVPSGTVAGLGVTLRLSLTSWTSWYFMGTLAQTPINIAPRY
jgi:hypothetical protein